MAGLLLGVAAVSTSSILARFAMGDEPQVVDPVAGAVPALGVAFWRSLGGAVALLPLALRARRKAPAMSTVRRRQLAASGAALALHFVLFQGSLALTTVASAVTLVTMSPVFVALGGWWFLGERTQARTWIGMAVTIAGAVVVGVADAGAIDLGGTALVGDAMAFGGAIAVTGYLLLGRLARRDVPTTLYSSIVYGWSASILLALCLALGVPLAGYDSTAWLALAGLLIGPQLLGHTVLNATLGAVPATVVSIVVLFEPVGATLLAWLLLGELPAALFWAGGPLVLVGVATATVRRRPRPAADDLPPP